MNKTLLLIPFLACFFISNAQINYCIPNRFSENYYFDTSEIKSELNVLYGNAFNKYKNVSEDLKLDIYYPDTTIDALSRRPMILHIHGGSFLEGDKSGGAVACREWARRGFVAATINYRMGWACANTVAALLCLCNDASGIRTAMYEAIQDSRAAMRYLKAHADEYGIDPDYIFIAGESAGSITALMTAYTDQAEADAFTNGTLYLQLGALDSSGNNHPGGYRIRGIINNCGAVNDTSIIGSNDVLPSISFHDEGDCLVPIKSAFVLNCTGNCWNYVTATGSWAIHQKTQSLGVCSKLYEVKGSNLHCSFPLTPLIKKSSCFMRGILCNDCQSGYSTNANDTVACEQSIPTGTDLINETWSELKIYPNPSNGDYALVTFELEKAEQISIQFTDLLGREMFHHQSWFESGRNNITVPIRSFPSGVYYVRMQTKAGFHTAVFIHR